MREPTFVEKALAIEAEYERAEAEDDEFREENVRAAIQRLRDEANR